MTIVARFIDRSDDAIQWLACQDGVGSPIGSQNEVTFNIPNDPNRQAALLRGLVENGFQLVSYASKQKTLEQAFLEVTQGRVQ